MIFSKEQEILNVYDHALDLINYSGSASVYKIMKGMRSGAYEIQDFFSILDLLESTKRLVCINNGCAKQDRVYIKGRN